MDERRHEPERADENARRSAGEPHQPPRTHTADGPGQVWRDADQPDGWRHTDEPPLTERERRERWPLG
jgi:hypothetical protein